MTATIEDPAVAAFVKAVNAGDREAFFETLTTDATMADDGTERDLPAWVDREIFTVSGHLEVESAAEGGRELTATYSNTTWGGMRTHWRFTVADGRVSRFETGQG